MTLKKFINEKLRALKIHILAHNPKKLADYYFKISFGRTIDWKYPRDLNEWINVLMHTTDTSQWTRLADKYRVREYVSQKGFEDTLIPLYGMWETPEEINTQELPSQFVLKANNGNDSVMLCDNTSPDVYKTAAKKWLRNGFGKIQCEPHYCRIRPCIIAEKRLDAKLQDTKSDTLIDYKIWCIHGEPLYIMTFHDRSKRSISVNLYDTGWNEHNEYLVFNSYYNRNSGVPKPRNLDYMLHVARSLSQGFPQVRVDLYNVDNHIYFGEMTFSARAGRMTCFTDDMQKMLGDKIAQGFTTAKG